MLILWTYVQLLTEGHRMTRSLYRNDGDRSSFFSAFDAQSRNLDCRRA